MVETTTPRRSPRRFTLDRRFAIVGQQAFVEPIADTKFVHPGPDEDELLATVAVGAFEHRDPFGVRLVVVRPSVIGR